MKKFTALWLWLVHQFEHGDLVPLIVIVSAVHYAAVLATKDAWPVAIAIGLLVDLGHYRTIRYAARYNGARKWEKVFRWAIAATMSGVSLGYHWRFYADVLLAAPLPFLIAVLAWLPERKSETLAKPVPAPLPQSEPAPALEPTFTAHCDCGWAHNSYTSEVSARNALNAHRRKHAEKETRP